MSAQSTAVTASDRHLHEIRSESQCTARQHTSPATMTYPDTSIMRQASASASASSSEQPSGHLPRLAVTTSLAAQAAAALHPCMTGIACQDVQDEHPDDSSFCFDDDDDGIPATDPLVQSHMQSLTAAPTEAPATAKPALYPQQAVLPASSNIEIKVTAVPQQHTTATSNTSKQAGPPTDSNMPDATQISDDENPDTSLGADSQPHIIIRYGRPTGPAWILSIKAVLQ